MQDESGDPLGYCFIWKRGILRPGLRDYLGFEATDGAVESRLNCYGDAEITRCLKFKPTANNGGFQRSEMRGVAPLEAKFRGYFQQYLMQRENYT